MTTASTKTYLASAVPQGPIDIWVDVGLPAASATVVLAADGTPDSATNGSARHLGKLKDGAKISYKPKINEYYSDEGTSPFRLILDLDELTISGSWMQLQDSQLLTRMLAGSTRTTDTTTYQQITGGGLVTPPSTYVICAVWQQPEAPTKYVSVVGYKMFASDGVDFNITKKNPADSPFTLKALAIDSRAVGDTMGHINIQV